MKTCKQLPLVLGALILGWLMPLGAKADGLIIIHDPPHVVPGHFTFAPLEVTYHRVNVEITDQVAVTRVDQEFRNPNNQRMEGTYIFPLPEGAHIDKFTMDVNGQMMEAELLSAEKARGIYEEIVRKQKDPALLEYIGRGAFKVRIFPIEPNSTKQIKLQYTQLLKPDSGVTEYTYPLNTEKFSSRPLQEVSVKVTLNCREAIKTLYCPSHNVDIRREGQNRAVVGYEQKNVRPDTDFKLIYSRNANPVGIDLLSWRKGNEDGYFLLLASPGMDASRKAIQPQDICLVLDTSGSMAGPKLQQAKRALNFCLANLNAGDRFEIIRFSTEPQAVFGALRDATPDNIQKAQEFIKDLKAIGGTAIYDALGKAIETLSSKQDQTRPCVVIFLTDGQPTVGETREQAILGRLKNAGAPLRIFPFGIGTDVNTSLLDQMAGQSRGASQYVLPEEDIEVKVSNFYSKIKEPVLTNIAVSFTGNIRSSEVYPHDLPDLFKGETLMLLGRYSGKGPSAVQISGMLNGEKRTFITDVNFVDNDTRNDFIPQLWATRRVGWLLDEIRLRGESMELKDEVTRLAREYGIVTPYTAYLIVEDENRRNVPVGMRNFRELERDRVGMDAVGGTYSSASASSGRRGVSGPRAVQNAQTLDDLKQSTNTQQYRTEKAMASMAKAPASPTPEHGYRATQNYAQQARVVNGRAFYQNGSTWTDSTAQGKKNLRMQQIKFNSEEYFALLKAHPTAAPWLALGSEVDVVLDDTLYQIRQN